MKYAIAIDVGIKNLGFCVFDFTQSKVVHWHNYSLVPTGPYVPSRNVQYVRDFIQSKHKWFDEAMVVIIERQMRANMRIIESVIHALHFDKTVVINPKAVKVHYDLSMRNYKLNKQVAVE